jgi:hypothetical protein
MKWSKHEGLPESCNGTVIAGISILCSSVLFSKTLQNTLPGSWRPENTKSKTGPKSGKNPRKGNETATQGQKGRRYHRQERLRVHANSYNRE